jgi:hypothetical protein
MEYKNVPKNFRIKYQSIFFIVEINFMQRYEKNSYLCKMFREKIIFLGFCLFSLTVFAQRNAVGQWRDHYSYNNVSTIVVMGNEICGVAENGLFFYDKKDHSIRRKTTIQGLSDVGLTASGYDPSTQIQVAGYENGNIDLILQNGRVINIPDIFRWQTSGSKRINKVIVESSQRVYLCCDFGIVVLNLLRREIREHYFIGPNNSNVQVNDLAFGNLLLGDSSIYAATDIGLLRAHNRFSPRLAADTSWHQVPVNSQIGQPLSNVDFWNQNLIVLQSGVAEDDDTIWYRNSENVWHLIDSERSNGIKISKNRLFQLRKIPDEDWIWEIREYDSNFQVLKVYRGEDMYGLWGLRDIEIDSENNIWISTGFYGLSLLTSDWRFVGHILPRGPATNKVYALTHSRTTLYSANGATSGSSWHLARQTFSVDILQNGNWQVFDYRNVNPSKRLEDAIAVAEDPRNPNVFVVASWEAGVVQRNANGTTTVYNEENSTLEGHYWPAGSGNLESVRVGDVKFDKKNNLWMTNAFSKRQLHKRLPYPSDSFRTYDLGHLIPRDAKEFIIDYYDQLWIRDRDGLVFFREASNALGYDALRANLNLGNEQKVSMVNCLVEDNKGFVWLGTNRGILVNRTSRRLFDNPNGLESRVTFETINFVEEGAAGGRPLLENESVTAIAVDGADRKWIGTASSGVFLMSADGRKMIHHFNMQNSPLNSDAIKALAINPQTGDVFIGTDKGLMAFGGDATVGSQDKQKIVIFPNPVHADFMGEIAIQGLVEHAHVHITDVNGTLVFETRANGGMATWNGNSRNGQRVRPGVYVVFATNDDGSIGSVGKIFFNR